MTSGGSGHVPTFRIISIMSHKNYSITNTKEATAKCNINTYLLSWRTLLGNQHGMVPTLSK
jgi:hypothetical protein